MVCDCFLSAFSVSFLEILCLYSNSEVSQLAAKISIYRLFIAQTPSLIFRIITGYRIVDSGIQSSPHFLVYGFVWFSQIVIQF